MNISTTSDLVNRDVTAMAANQLWGTDITEHATIESRVFVFVASDAYPCNAAGWAIGKGTDTTLVNSGIDMAAQRRAFTTGSTIHADHGLQGGFNWSSQHLGFGGVHQ